MNEDRLRILNNRLTVIERRRASREKVEEDEAKGDFDIDLETIEKLDEDLWYVLKDKLDGAEANGKLKGLKQGEGIKAYQKIYKWYAAVTGIALTGKMNQAMSPAAPKKINEVASCLEQWNALVEALEKHGPEYNLPIPFRIIALKVIMHHAGDWFETWKDEYFKAAPPNT